MSADDSQSAGNVAREVDSPPVLLPQPSFEDRTREMADLNRRLVEAQADYDNLRRSTERERADWIEEASATGSLLMSTDVDLQYAHGVKLIYQRLADTLKSWGLEPISAVGERFDPRLHEAVQRVEAGSRTDPLVVDEYRKCALHESR